MLCLLRHKPRALCRRASHLLLPPQPRLAAQHSRCRALASQCGGMRARTCDQAGRLQADAHEGQDMGVAHARHKLRLPLELAELSSTQRPQRPCRAALPPAQAQLLDSK